MRNRIILMILVVLLAECSMKRISIPASNAARSKAKHLHPHNQQNPFTAFASACTMRLSKQLNKQLMNIALFQQLLLG